tara:strand:+ start:9847 stop:10575 length:729 start_codon:yes stop_codon:yes gene_type:complete
MDFRKIDNLSVDCVVLRLEGNLLNVLLRKRTLNLYDENLPVIDDWILPGHYVLKSNNLGETANRVFKELTGEDDASKNQFRTYGNPNRIKSDKDLLWVRSRGAKVRTITVAYYLIVASNKVLLDKDDSLKWFKLKSLPQMGFDHHKIVNDAYEDIKSKIITDPLIFDFVPIKFTLNELQTAFESVLDVELDNRNFRKKVSSKSYIVPLEEKQKGVSKKPSRLYMFSSDVYNQVAETDFIINK